MPGTFFCLRRSILKFCIGFLAIVGLSGCATCFKCQRHNKIEVHGHRGARAVLPENTLPAFEYALAHGVDYLEMDLGVTKDNVLVINHDPTINPSICKYKDGRDVKPETVIHSLTLKQVKAFDCGAKRNPRFLEQQIVPNTEVPTFDELMTALDKSLDASAKTVHLNIETKSDPAFPTYQPEPKKFAELVLKAIEKHHLQDRVVIQSFDYRTIIELKKMAPHIRTSALIEERPNIDLVKLVQDAKAEIASPNFEWLTKADVEALHNAHIGVHPWTLNSKSDWQRARDIGVDGIISDEPAALVEFLKK